MLGLFITGIFKTFFKIPKLLTHASLGKQFSILSFQLIFMTDVSLVCHATRSQSCPGNTQFCLVAVTIFLSQRKHCRAVHGDNLEFTTVYFFKSKSFANLGNLTLISYNLLRMNLTVHPDISIESYYQRPSSNKGPATFFCKEPDHRYFYFSGELFNSVTIAHKQCLSE